MKTERLEVRVSPEFLARVDAVRGDVSRSRFVLRALESALGAVEATATAVPGEGRPVSSRAPVLRMEGPVRRVEPYSVMPRVGPKRAVAPIPKKGK